MNKVLVFTGNNCAKCDSLKARLKDKGYSDGVNYFTTPVMENMALAKKHGVRSVPTTVVVDEEGNQVAFYISDNKVDEIISHM